MELIISGYGEKGKCNMIKCDLQGNVIWEDTVEAPSFVITAGNRLFAGTEVENYSELHSYIKDGNGYRLVDTARFDGGFLCHVCYSEKHNMLFGACWGTGHLIYASMNDEGRFVKTGSIFQPIENGDETLVSRVHYVGLCQNESTLMVNNVGLDIIYFYEIRNGELYEKDRIYTEKDQHPRHSAFNKDESRLYVITELSNEVLVYAMPEKKLLQRISTLPEGFVGKSHCSAICLSPDEKTVYGANRYSESLAFFGVNADGTLYEKLRLPTDGEKPRHMILTKDGKHLIVLYQVSGEVCIMPIGEDGLPIEGASYKFRFHDAACAAEV